MKHRGKVYVFFIGMLLLLSLAACKSAPPAPPEEEPPPPPPAAPAPAPAPEVDPDTLPPDEAALDSLNRALAGLEEARKRALDFDAPLYFPQEWEETEAQYQVIGDEVQKTTLGDVKTAISRYEALTAAYEEHFQKSVPRYAQDRTREILEARVEALNRGAEEILPDFLIQADETAVEALTEYEREEYYPAAAAAALALELYQVLKTGTEAYEVRLEIEERDIARYDPKNFELADGAGNAAIAAYKAENPPEAQARAEEALLRYNLALKNGMEAHAAERGAFAAEERRIALELKANVAVRYDFASAEALYQRADQAMDEENYDLAAELFEESAILFVRTQQDTLEKRRIAEDALKNAEEKMVESDETARQAEMILEGGAQ